MVSMRRTAREHGREVHCSRNTLNRRINSSTSVFEALQTFTLDQKRNLLLWLTRQGPFWEDVPVHGPNEWLESGGEIVTETAAGEAAYCSTFGIDRRLVSLTPSAWNYSPIVVTLLSDVATAISIDNYRAPSELEAALRGLERPIVSWGQLEAAARVRFCRLSFSSGSFRPLDGQPFVPGAASRILSRMAVLDSLMGAVDDTGSRTLEGHRLYQDHCTGDKAGFSDSSATEKREFEKELTFPHPDGSGHSLFCTWHGKINHPPFRIHFAWPEQAGAPLYVVYIGLKITRQ